MKKRTYSKDAYMLFSQVGFKYLFYIACILVILEELLILFKITINIEYIFRFIFIFVSISIFTVTFLLSKTDKRLIWKLSAFEALYASFMLLFNFSGLNLYVNFDMFSDDPGQLFNLRLNITGSILDVLTQFIGLLIIIALLINTSIIFNSWEQLK